MTRAGGEFFQPYEMIVMRFPSSNRRAWQSAVAALASIVVASSLEAAPPPRLEWAGQGGYRVVVRVDARAEMPSGDEGPADVPIDFEKMLGELAPGRRPDLATIEVIAHDGASGRAAAGPAYAFGRGKLDVACRWYDDAIPYDFPEFEDNISQTDGVLRYVARPRFGYFYPCTGDWRRGRLAFAHRAAAGASCYAVYFDLLPPGGEPRDNPPRGFLGDGLERCEPRGASTTGLIHSRVTLADWNGDGLFDLIVGCSRGGLVWYPNRGRPGVPEFPMARLVFTADGKPLDVGWGSAPCAVDWNGDGLVDLLVGAERNRLLLYVNRGSKEQPKLDYSGLVRTDDGQPLVLPVEPVPEGDGVFKVDYYPVVEAVDWDDDGDLDLLAGGYITGRVYFYENVGTPAAPKLRLAAPLEADGAPLDVVWAAAPAVGDLDGDGDLDLISGAMKIKHGGDVSSSEHFLHYFRNDGAKGQAHLHEIPFPRMGDFPRAALASPRLVDWNADGLMDLVVSSSTEIYFYRNVGTPREPRFEAHAKALESRWGSVPLGLVQMLDFNGDGLLDGANGPNIYLNTGRGSPGLFASPTSLLKAGQKIEHLSGIGDDWRFQRLFDLDADGRFDLMDADHAGTIWWHRNRGSNANPDFETDGVHLKQTDGRLVQVGLDLSGFDKLQGARAAYTVGDFDGDGLKDLVVVDTLGIVRYFRQASRANDDGVPVFDAAIAMGKLPIRGVPYAADWDGDGRLDVVAGSDAAHVVVFVNRGKSGDGAPFAPAVPIRLPQAPYGAGAPLVVADYNGDGDQDVIVQTAYGYTCFYERTFIRAGYAHGEAVAAEKRGD